MSSRILVGIVLTVLAVGPAWSQSLGAVAAREAARRKAIVAPSHVITADELTPDRTIPRPAAPTSTPVVVDESTALRVESAVYQSGRLPEIPVLVVAAGEVVLELTVDDGGSVTEVRTLRETPPFTEQFIAAVRTWRFTPAIDAARPAPGETIDPATRKAVTSHVLVAAVFRPPALFPFTLGQAPTTVASPGDDVPAPTGPLPMPVYPPRALFDGVLLTQVQVNDDGSQKAATIVQSSPGLDGAALDAVRTMRFRPAQVHGRPSAAQVYVVAAFRQPVTF